MPKKYQVVKCAAYHLNDKIIFYKDGFNADRYVKKGLGGTEDWGSWMEGDQFEMCFYTDSAADKLQGEINCNVFNGSQNVIIFANNVKVFEDKEYQGGSICFDFDNPGVKKPINIRIELPDAISRSGSGYSDEGTSGLGFMSVVYSVWEG